MISKIFFNILCLAAALFAQQPGTAARNTTLKPDSLNDARNIRQFLPDSSRITADSVGVNDSLAAEDSVRKPVRPVRQLLQMPLESYSHSSYFIPRGQLGSADYRFTGDILSAFPLFFHRELGSPGQPAESALYGAGFNQISFLQDGLMLNNRLLNTGSLFQLQSELVDSVEILPAPRGFLYGTFNNQSALNFISRDAFSLEKPGTPYSRIRYYQAQNEEAMVDFIYNSRFFKKFNTTFELTNHSFGSQSDVRFTNSDFSQWNILLKSAWLISDFYTLQAGYNYMKSRTGLFGGLTKVYADSVDAAGEMDERTAEVEFTDRYSKETSGNYYAQLLGNPFEGNRFDLRIFYSDQLFEFRQNEDSSLTDYPFIKENNRIRTYGASFRDYLNWGPLALSISASYENNKIRADLNEISKDFSAIAASFTASAALLDSALIPSVFGKHLIYDKKNYSGFGADIVYHMSGSLKFYAGYSAFSQPLNIIESAFRPFFKSHIVVPPKDKPVSTFQAGVNIRYENLSMSFNGFRRSVVNDPAYIIFAAQNPAVKIFSDIEYGRTDLYGAGAGISFHVYKLSIEPSFAYYFNRRENQKNLSMPEFTFNGGIWYRDTLFNNNLNLKAGIYASFTGAQDFYSYDFQNMVRTRLVEIGNAAARGRISPGVRLDLKLIAEIQKNAVLFFTLENLLDNLYFIVPYYFAPGRGLRLGFSWEFLN